MTLCCATTRFNRQVKSNLTGSNAQTRCEWAVALPFLRAEVREARVEGFLPPRRFLERMHYAARAGQRAARE